MKRLSILFAITAIFALPMVACGDDDGGTQEICGNGIDDDHNGYTDCLDSACTNSSFCQATCDNDGTCDTAQGETAANCMADCHCGNGICDSAAPYNETTATCAADCTANPCDNDGTCEPAQGETTVNCAADCAANPCDNDGTCEPAQGETVTNCAADCAANPCDNDGTCEPAQGETLANCPADCDTTTGSLSCSALNYCYNCCADQACYTACDAAASASGTTEMDALMTCVQTSCQTECSGTDTAACNACVDTNCSSELTACDWGPSGTGGCMEINTCLNGCTVDPLQSGTETTCPSETDNEGLYCYNDCFGAASQANFDAYMALIDCIFNVACPTECDGTDPTACQTCQQTAMGQGGECYTQVTNCQ